MEEFIKEAFEKWEKAQEDQLPECSQRDAFHAGAALMVKQLSDNFTSIIEQERAMRDEADKSAGLAWRMLRRYKHKVRELNRTIETLEKA